MWLAWWALGAPAHAVDLDAWLPLGPVTFHGLGEGDGAAADVAIDATGHLVAVGTVPGAEGHGTNGYVVALEYDDLSYLWSIEIDAGLVGTDVDDSDDRLNAIARPADHEIAFCGRMASPPIVDHPRGGFWVNATVPDPDGIHYLPQPGWELLRRDGVSSDDQECLGLHRAGSTLLAAGYSQHEPEAGRWVTHRLQAETGGGPAPVTWADGQPTFEERAHGVAGGALGGSVVVVGTRASSSGALDGHVRFYDHQDQLIWQSTHAGAAGLDDELFDVVYDEKGGTVTVVGVERENPKDPEQSWVVLHLDASGNGQGGPRELWRTYVGRGNGVDDVATSVVLDAQGDVVVGGSTTTAGVEVWHLAKLSADTGEVLQTWSGPVHEGDSRIQGLDRRGEKLALAGYLHDGTSRVFTVGALEPDGDGDGVPDSPDECPHDPLKHEPGVCGCGVSDTLDRDADGTVDCLDVCPDDPEKADSEGLCGCGVSDRNTDGDRVVDCLDGCPDDPDKTMEGLCGCGVPDHDTDYDDLPDCQDACPHSEIGALVDAYGCPVTEATPRCGCALPPRGPSGGLIGLLALALLRRRGSAGAGGPPPAPETT